MEKYRHCPMFLEDSMAPSKPSHRRKKSLWNWVPMRAFAKIRQQQFYCVFSIFVQTIDGLPSYMDGLRLVVQLERKSKRWQTLPSRVFQHTVEFDETLHIETTIFGRKTNMENHSLKFLSKNYVLSVVAIDAEEHFLFNRHRLDLSRLLPVFIERFWEPEKPMSSTASFKLGGKAEGAVLVATFDFEVLNEDLQRPDGNASARFGGSSLQRVSRAVKSLPNSPNPSPFVRRANHHFTSPRSSDADSTDSTCIGKFDLDSSAKETEEWSVYDYSSSDEERFQALKNDPLSLDAFSETEIVTTPAIRGKKAVGSLDDSSTQIHLVNVECVEEVEIPLVYSFKKMDTLGHQIDVVERLLNVHEAESNSRNILHGNKERGKLEVLEKYPQDGEVAADKFCINIEFVNSSPTTNIPIIGADDTAMAVSLEGLRDDRVIPPSCVKFKCLDSDGEVFSPEKMEMFSEKHLLVEGDQHFSLKKVECTPIYCENEGGVCIDVQAHSDGGVPVAHSWGDMGHENGLENLSDGFVEGLDVSASSLRHVSEVLMDVHTSSDGKAPVAQSWENVRHENGLENFTDVSVNGGAPFAHSWKDLGHETGLKILSNVSAEGSDILTPSSRNQFRVSMDDQAQSNGGVPGVHSLEDVGHKNDVENLLGLSMEGLNFSASSPVNETPETGLKISSNVSIEGLDLLTSSPRNDIGVSMDVQVQSNGGIPGVHSWEDVGHENGEENFLGLSMDGLNMSASSPRNETPETDLKISSNVSVEGLDLLTSSPRNNIGVSMDVQVESNGRVPGVHSWKDVGHRNGVESFLGLSMEGLNISASSPRNETSETGLKISSNASDEGLGLLFSSPRNDVGVSMNVQVQSNGGVSGVHSWEDVRCANGVENLLGLSMEGLNMSASLPRNETPEFFQFSSEDEIWPEASFVVEDFFNLLEREEESTCLELNYPVEGALKIDDKPMSFSKEIWALSAKQEESFSFESLKSSEKCLPVGILQEGHFTCGIPIRSCSKYDLLDETSEDDLGLFSIIEAAELEMRKADQSLQSKERAKMLEDAETKALMKEWGLSDKVFERPVQKSLLCSASEISHLSHSISLMALNDGSCLKAMSAHNSCGNLMMQVSKPVVIPASTSSCALDILSSMALQGLEDMTVQIFMKMPLEDLEGSLVDHVLRGGVPINCDPSSWQRPFHGLNMKESPTVLTSNTRNCIGYKPFKVEPLSEQLVAFEDLTHVALQTIEPLSIEGLKLQCNFFKEAPGSISPENPATRIDMNNQVSEEGLQEKSLVDDGREVAPPDTASPLDIAISLDEWLCLFEHVTMIEGEYSVAREASQKAASGNTENIPGWSTWAHHSNSFAVAMRLQLRDPQRYYEPVGASMLALVQVERLKEACVGSKVSSSAGAMDSALETHSGVQLRLTAVHIAGVQQSEDCRSQFWGTKKELQSGSRWLLANFKGINLKHMMSQSSSPSKVEAKPVKRELLWSITSCAHTPGSSWREPEDHLYPCTRNPDIIFAAKDSL